MRLTLTTLALLTSAVLATAAHAQTKEERIEPSRGQMAKLQALTPEQVATQVTINDDDLEPIATLTTERVYRSNGGFTDPVRSDNFLRAFIDKRTGTVRYQFYQSVTCNFIRRNFTTANYATPSGPIGVPLVSIANEVVVCPAGGCTYREVVGFDMSPELLVSIAASYAPGASPLWRVRFKAQNGVDWEDRMAPAEAAGLLLAVKAYQAKLSPAQ